MPPLPTADEQRAQADAYQKSAKELDARVELSGHSAKELEMTFERFLASLYMTAMLQLGLMHEEGGQARVDIIGARQTIDTLSLLAERTKGNLTSAEQNFCRTPSMKCAWPMWKLPMPWRVRPRLRLRAWELSPA